MKTPKKLSVFKKSTHVETTPQNTFAQPEGAESHNSKPAPSKIMTNRTFCNLAGLLPPLVEELNKAGEIRYNLIDYADVFRPWEASISVSGKTPVRNVPQEVKLLSAISGKGSGNIFKFVFKPARKLLPPFFLEDHRSNVHSSATLEIECDDGAAPEKVQEQIRDLVWESKLGRIRRSPGVRDFEHGFIFEVELLLAQAASKYPAVDRALLNSSAGMFPLQSTVAHWMTSGSRTSLDTVLLFSAALGEFARNHSDLKKEEILDALACIEKIWRKTNAEENRNA